MKQARAMCRWKDVHISYLLLSLSFCFRLFAATFAVLRWWHRSTFGNLTVTWICCSRNPQRNLINLALEAGAAGEVLECLCSRCSVDWYSVSTLLWVDAFLPHSFQLAFLQSPAQSQVAAPEFSANPVRNSFAFQIPPQNCFSSNCATSLVN